jgi:16S rRNA (cytosine1402-N4)-methyltransferase
LEDRIVKQFMKREAEGEPLPFSVPIQAKALKSSLKRIGKAIKPSQEEINNNIRGRSAVLRIGEKIA